MAAKARELAAAIHGDQMTANAVAAAALTRLPAAVMAQDKRVYYAYDDLRSRSTKIWLGREHLLQQLVFAESDAVERDDESRRALSANELLVRFLKHLVWNSTRRNVFYVTLAVGRLLYGFTTRATAELYCRLTDDGVKEDAYYRARKRVLIGELRERFPQLLMATGSRGERGIAMTVADDLAAARAAGCLASFAPWGAVCGLSSNEPLHLMHRLLHPRCFRALLTELGWPRAPRVHVPLLVQL